MPTEPLEHTLIGKYQLIAEIGRGGAATVYLAVMRGMTGFTKLFVVKLLHADIDFDEEELEMFRNEARLAARLNHPNVVQSLEFEEHEGRYYLAMEYLEGQPLSRVAAPPPEGMAPLVLEHHLQILSDTLGGLHYAHELNDYDGSPLSIVHRDVSPHNVFVTYDGVVKLLDFGIAKARGSKTNTSSGALKGKVAYMSPDQFSDDPADRRGDVFAVGVMLWEAVAGQRMWKGQADLDIIRNLMQGTIPSVQLARPDVPKELARICDRALAPDREERYPTAAAFRRELDAYLVSIGAHVTSSVISDYVIGRFAVEREKIRAVTQQQIQAIELRDGEVGAVGELPRLSLADAQTTGSHAGHRTGRSGRTPSGATREGLAAAAAAKRGPVGRVWAVRAGILLLTAAAIAAVTLWRFSSMTPVPPGASNASQAASSAPASEPRGDLVSISLTAMPASARIFVDDAPLPSNPFTGRFPRDGVLHRVRVEALGYATGNELLAFERDAARTITLTELLDAAPGAKVGQPGKTPVAPHDGKTRPPTSATAPATAPTRTIDDHNPFK
jgi:eukaryotic-like serine/threonine-protein kinase